MKKSEQQQAQMPSTEELPNKKKVKANIERKSVLDFRKYTQQIWLAGLGAFSRAEEEGNKLFDSLVKVGEELELKTTEIADQAVEKVALKAKEQVIDTKDKVDRMLDQSVNHSINKLGFATTKDVQQLERLILQLQDKVDQLIEEQKKNSTK